MSVKFQSQDPEDIAGIQTGPAQGKVRLLGLMVQRGSPSLRRQVQLRLGQWRQASEGEVGQGGSGHTCRCRKATGRCLGHSDLLWEGLEQRQEWYDLIFTLRRL